MNDRIVETREERRKRRATEKRVEKKRRMKALFDAAYDAGEPDSTSNAANGEKTTFYEDQKSALLDQATVGSKWEEGRVGLGDCLFVGIACFFINLHSG